MSSDADAHKMGLILVILMMSGNIMGLGVSLLPANLASTGGIAIYGWLVTIIGALGFSIVYAKISFLDLSPGGSYAYARRCSGPLLGYQTNALYWLACWVGNIAMVIIDVGYLSYFFPILKDPLVLAITCVVALWAFVLLNIVGPKVTTRVQAVVTVLALIPVVGIAVFGWSWFCGKAYMAAWSVSGLGTFGAIQNTLNVTLWSFTGVESASAAAGVVKSLERNVPTATIGEVLTAAVRYILSTTAIMGMIPNAALRVPTSSFGNAARVTLGDTAGAIVSFYVAAGCLGSLGGRALSAGQMAKVAVDDGLFPPIFACINKVSTPVVGLIIAGILVTIFQLSSIPSNVTKEFGLASPVSVISILMPYLYICTALLLPGHSHLGKACPVYLAVTTIAFPYCIRVVAGSGAKEVMWSSVILTAVTAMYVLNYNRLHKNPYPLDVPMSKD